MKNTKKKKKFKENIINLQNNKRYSDTFEQEDGDYYKAKKVSNYNILHNNYYYY